MNTEFIWTDKLRCGGIPCIRGQRFSIAQMLAELADESLSHISDNFDIPLDNLKGAINDVIEELCLLKINTKHIMSDPETRGGANCLLGHRIPISMLLADLRDGDDVLSLSHDRELEKELEGM